MKTTLTISELEIGYKDNFGWHSVARELKAEFCSGQFIGIVGNNGIGKSTLLKTLVGIEQSLKGNISLNKKSIKDFSKEDLAKYISIVLTERISGFQMTVWELVGMGRIPYTNMFNQLQEDDREIIQQCIAQVGMSDKSHLYIEQLSDGMYQKAMIAKALAQQTPVILLDEPTSFLDYSSKRRTMELLKSLAIEQDKCVIASSHDIDLLLKHTTHLLVMDEGKSIFIPTEEAATNPFFKKLVS